MSRWIFERLGRHRWALPAMVVLGLLAPLAESVGISLFIPLLGTAIPGGGGSDLPSRLLERLVGDLDPDTRLQVVAGAIVVSVILRSALTFASDAIYAWIYARAGHELRTDLHDRLLRSDFAWLQGIDNGRLLNALSNETWNTVDAMALALRMVTLVCTITIYAALLVLLSWQLTLVVLGSLLAISGIVRLPTRPLRKLSTAMTEDNGVLATRMLESCEGAKVVRAFGRETDVSRRFHESSWRVAHALRRMELLKAGVNPVYEVMAAGLIVAVLYVALMGDPSSLPSVLVFLVVLYRLQPRVKELDTNRVALLRLAGGVEEVATLLDEGVPTESDGSIDASTLRPAFRFEGVSFRYREGDAPALDAVDVDVPAGRTTALVGPSGAGKSTFVDLLLGFYAPTAGTVSMDGHLISDLHRSTLRQRVALVSQSTFLFNGSIAENIAFGRPEATSDEIAEAARLANAAEFIDRLPEGYDTLVGDNGVRLSGGQRQRLALARAVLRRPDVLILDEATNALDSISERLVQDALDQLSVGRTVVVIAHRLSTIRAADHVVVLDGGRVSEQGPPAELLRREDGLFTQLNDLQQAFQVVPDES